MRKGIRGPIVRALVSCVLIAAFIVFYVAPTSRLPPWQTAVTIFLIQVVAILSAAYLARGKIGEAIVRTLVIGVLMAAFIVFLLVPRDAIGFDQTLIDVLAIEAVAAIGAPLITRAG